MGRDTRNVRAPQCSSERLVGIESAHGDLLRCSKQGWIEILDVAPIDIRRSHCDDFTGGSVYACPPDRASTIVHRRRMGMAELCALQRKSALRTVPRGDERHPSAGHRHVNGHITSSRKDRDRTIAAFASLDDVEVQTQIAGIFVNYGMHVS